MKAAEGAVCKCKLHVQYARTRILSNNRAHLWQFFELVAMHVQLLQFEQIVEFGGQELDEVTLEMQFLQLDVRIRM